MRAAPEVVREVDTLRDEVTALKAEEEELEKHVVQARRFLQVAQADTEIGQFAYVTPDDVKSLPDTRTHYLFAVHARMGSRLHVPDASDMPDSAISSYSVFISSDMPVETTFFGVDGSGGGMDVEDEDEDGEGEDGEEDAAGTAGREADAAGRGVGSSSAAAAAAAAIGALSAATDPEVAAVVLAPARQDADFTFAMDASEGVVDMFAGDFLV